MNLKINVRIGKEKIFLGKGVRMLLDAIDEYHSIKKASEATGISYPKALRMMKDLSEGLGFDVIVSERGGSTGGGTVLTEEGKAVLEAYREIENSIYEYSESLIKAKFKYLD